MRFTFVYYCNRTRNTSIYEDKDDHLSLGIFFKKKRTSANYELELPFVSLSLCLARLPLADLEAWQNS
ncbi:hypothetical protein Taro_000814 [Colocasia esculenta]|uniref:Uncharacterized protein n=1 Tax=Colocasia esculenta TaxID=4460 RepID=A0A843TGG6_COLES|nr:hypothetical protein [Colocasia esculenta]